MVQKLFGKLFGIKFAQDILNEPGFLIEDLERAFTEKDAHGRTPLEINEYPAGHKILKDHMKTYHLFKG